MQTDTPGTAWTDEARAAFKAWRDKPGPMLLCADDYDIEGRAFLAGRASQDAELARLKSEVSRLNGELADRGLPPEVRAQLASKGRVEWGGAIYYRDYEAYCDD